MTQQGYSTDSCTVTVRVNCPRLSSDYWKSLILIESKDKKYWFLNQKEKLTLPKGQYKFTLYSDFDDFYDTTITLEKDAQKIRIEINWNYIFKEYKNSILEAEKDTIVIWYEKKICSGGVGAQDRDKMLLFKTTSGQYFIRYFDPIIHEFSLGKNRTD